MAPSPPPPVPAFRRHLARTSRGRNFTQRATPGNEVVTTPQNQAATQPQVPQQARARQIQPPTNLSSPPVPGQRQPIDRNTYRATINGVNEDSVGFMDVFEIDPHDFSNNGQDNSLDVEGDEGDVEEGAIDDEGGLEVEEEEDVEGAIDEADKDEFDASGLREISNLACWTVSTHKPGCGVAALRDEDVNLFWQSDGPQPHHLNIHFVRRVEICALRIYLDFEADESYTPTKITFLAGSGYHDLIVFQNIEFTQPKGWIDISLKGMGGGSWYDEEKKEWIDGDLLCCFLVQIKVVENHQNGKDTHIRGVRLYAAEEGVRDDLMEVEELMDVGLAKHHGQAKADTKKKTGKKSGLNAAFGGLSMLDEPDWMGEPELR